MNAPPRPAATLRLDRSLEGAVASGHPWIYRNHLPRTDARTGDWVRVEAGSEAAYGLYDADSPIAVRLYSRTDVPDRDWIAARVREALETRSVALEAQDTNAYRLLYGEGDGLPGVTVDLYERYAVLMTYAASVQSVVPDVVRAVAKEPPAGVRLRGIVTRTDAGLEPLWGSVPPPELTVREHGLQFLANLHHGQKTGLFLDHRENRRTLEGFARGRSVLNLFAYSGAFSLYAARGGATRVTSVDIAPAAMDDAKRNFELNGFDAREHEFVVADVFALLERMNAEGRSFDMVVLDPPSLARKKDSRHAAARAYRRLNALAARCTAPGGLLATASCTSQIAPEAFRGILADAARDANARLHVLHEAGHAPDHPVPAHFPEGRYLKYVIARVLPSV